MAKFTEMATDVISEMKEVRPQTTQDLRKLENCTAEMAETLKEISLSAHDEFFRTLISDVIENDYDLGKVQNVYRVFGGWVNRSFGIYTNKNGERQTWFVRMYIRGKSLDQILFEHSLLLYLQQNGFSLAAFPVKASSGLTYTTRQVNTRESVGEETYYFAVFNYIGGEHTYGWIPGLWQDSVTDTTIKSVAQCLAQMHSAGFGFDPEGRCGDTWARINEDISMNDLISRYPQIRAEYRKNYAKAGLNDPYTDYFDSHVEIFEDACAEATMTGDDYSDLIVCPCHNDYHCDNLKYNPDGTVAGVYDFDSSKLDVRIFDLGTSVHTLFASWRDDRNGFLDMDRVKLYLSTYNEECKRIGRIPPLNDTERKCLYQAFLQGAIYLDWWCTGDVNINPDINGFEYAYYARHFVHSIRWIKGHKKEIEELRAKL